MIILYIKQVERTLLLLAAINLFPNSKVTLLVPIKTISMIVRTALLLSLSNGDIKLPAALFMIMSGRPRSAMHLSATVITASGSRTSNA